MQGADYGLAAMSVVLLLLTFSRMLLPCTVNVQLQNIVCMMTG